jgi:D-arabinose 1-dehydrogenase-like Zn-dependent alcohol dehydrogenase
MTQTTTATMLAAVYNGDGHMLVESISVPEPRAGEVLIAVSHCGICGTDLHLVLEE